MSIKMINILTYSVINMYRIFITIPAQNQLTAYRCGTAPFYGLNRKVHSTDRVADFCVNCSTPSSLGATYAVWDTRMRPRSVFSSTYRDPHKCLIAEPNTLLCQSHRLPSQCNPDEKAHRGVTGSFRSLLCSNKRSFPVVSRRKKTPEAKFTPNPILDVPRAKLPIRD